MSEPRTAILLLDNDEGRERLRRALVDADLILDNGPWLDGFIPGSPIDRLIAALREQKA